MATLYRNYTVVIQDTTTYAPNNDVEVFLYEGRLELKANPEKDGATDVFQYGTTTLALRVKDRYGVNSIATVANISTRPGEYDFLEINLNEVGSASALGNTLYSVLARPTAFSGTDDFSAAAIIQEGVDLSDTNVKQLIKAATGSFGTVTENIAYAGGTVSFAQYEDGIVVNNTTQQYLKLTALQDSVTEMQRTDSTTAPPYGGLAYSTILLGRFDISYASADGLKTATWQALVAYKTSSEDWVIKVTADMFNTFRNMSFGSNVTTQINLATAYLNFKISVNFISFNVRLGHNAALPAVPDGTGINDLHILTMLAETGSGLNINTPHVLDNYTGNLYDWKQFITAPAQNVFYDGKSRDYDNNPNKSRALLVDGSNCMVDSANSFNLNIRKWWDRDDTQVPMRLSRVLNETSGEREHFSLQVGSKLTADTQDYDDITWSNFLTVTHEDEYTGSNAIWAGDARVGIGTGWTYADTNTTPSYSLDVFAIASSSYANGLRVTNGSNDAIVLSSWGQLALHVFPALAPTQGFISNMSNIYAQSSLFDAVLRQRLYHKDILGDTSTILQGYDTTINKGASSDVVNIAGPSASSVYDGRLNLMGSYDSTLVNTGYISLYGKDHATQANDVQLVTSTGTISIANQNAVAFEATVANTYVRASSGITMYVSASNDLVFQANSACLIMRAGSSSQNVLWHVPSIGVTTFGSVGIAAAPYDSTLYLMGSTQDTYTSNVSTAYLTLQGKDEGGSGAGGALALGTATTTGDIIIQRQGLDFITTSSSNINFKFPDATNGTFLNAQASTVALRGPDDGATFGGYATLQGASSVAEGAFVRTYGKNHAGAGTVDIRTSTSVGEITIYRRGSLVLQTANLAPNTVVTLAAPGAINRSVLNLYGSGGLAGGGSVQLYGDGEATYPGNALMSTATTAGRLTLRVQGTDRLVATTAATEIYQQLTRYILQSSIFEGGKTVLEDPIAIDLKIAFANVFTAVTGETALHLTSGTTVFNANASEVLIQTPTTTGNLGLKWHGSYILKTAGTDGFLILGGGETTGSPYVGGASLRGSDISGSPSTSTNTAFVNVYGVDHSSSAGNVLISTATSVGDFEIQYRAKKMLYAVDVAGGLGAPSLGLGTDVTYSTSGAVGAAGSPSICMVNPALTDPYNLINATSYYAYSGDNRYTGMIIKAAQVVNGGGVPTDAEYYHGHIRFGVSHAGADLDSPDNRVEIGRCRNGAGASWDNQTYLAVPTVNGTSIPNGNTYGVPGAMVFITGGVKPYLWICTGTTGWAKFEPVP